MALLRSTSTAQGRDYPIEHVSDEGEVIELRNGTPETLYAKAKRELVAFKLGLSETLAADPRVSDACVRANIALARYVTVDKRTLKPTVAYLSNISMMAEAAIGSKTTAGKIRRTMVELGYWVDVGQTSDGCRLYQIENPRREAVQMHICEAREKLREDDTVRKENERRRNADRKAGRVPKTVTPQALEGAKIWDDRVPISDPNYLRAHLIDSSSEEGNNPTAGPFSILGREFPFPVPQTEDEAVSLLVSLFEGKENRPGLINYFRNKLMSGNLTPADIEKHLEAVA
ncbi:MAG: hypothetical protein EOS50_02005 [Mesorhizobium sp.]|uniref:hypothetical protein n=1 Tax=Mesorhizobium sp. TaxID=1871066 RepID=UPI000FE49CE2|nr:hypothetical protein [Mesorhizobium sp.]RWE60613.1 MAG: hypothetical protein EOS67_02320 [Mesorhizobium sp.]RWF58621.1 MAG: hypothetical protein EOS50_02005 [Mesorhizobium sp.]TIX96198.1 MAG: hypothetical protein E5V24_02115 [Mesorhizobium sp.]